MFHNASVLQFREYRAWASVKWDEMSQLLSYYQMIPATFLLELTSSFV
jgi:hypothetical protein